VSGRAPDEPDRASAETPVAGPSDPGEVAAEGGHEGVVGRSKGPRQVRAGDTLGRYELGDELGEGGMATVFRARDRELRRDVALKVMFPHLARRAEIVRRFHREARAAAGLEHANILRMYDVGGGEGDDPPYIVMELIRGRTLLQEIEQRGAMLAEIAACVGALMGDALAAAHAAGVIHRDVKPANVLIAPGGRLLLADFGVARLETEDSLVTRSGALLGTPAYMSPEQAIGETATAQSDLYSLGATLYQLATGGLPYGGSPAKVMSMIAAGALVAPVRRRPSCGADLSRLIERLMAIDPAARPTSAQVIAGELRALAAAGGFGDATEELAAYFADPDGFLRTRTPTVVSSLVNAARTAVVASKLPRAMALADRASVLAPADPTVTALIETVTDGGRAQLRKRRLALGGVAVAFVGAALGLAWRITPARSRDGTASGDVVLVRGGPADPAIAAGDAAVALAGLANATGGSGDAATAPSGPAASETAPRDASTVRVLVEPAARPPGVAPEVRGSPGSNRPSRTLAGPAVARARSGPSAPGVGDSASAVPPSSAGPPSEVAAGTAVSASGSASIDAPAAHEPAAPDAASEPARATGHVIVRNDIWCNVWIDRIDRGNRRNEPIEVTAGHHQVRCVNPAGEWTQEADVAPGTTRTLTGTLLREFDVTMAVDATINGRYYRRGTVAKLKPGNVEVNAGGKKQFITFRASCTLRDFPELGCYL